MRNISYDVNAVRHNLPPPPPPKKKKKTNKKKTTTNKQTKKHHLTWTLCILLTPYTCTLAKCEDPDEMPQNAAFYKGLHVLLR